MAVTLKAIDVEGILKTVDVEDTDDEHGQTKSDGDTATSSTTEVRTPPTNAELTINIQGPMFLNINDC